MLRGEVEHVLHCGAAPDHGADDFLLARHDVERLKLERLGHGRQADQAELGAGLEQAEVGAKGEVTRGRAEDEVEAALLGLHSRRVLQGSE